MQGMSGIPWSEAAPIPQTLKRGMDVGTGRLGKVFWQSGCNEVGGKFTFLMLNLEANGTKTCQTEMCRSSQERTFLECWKQMAWNIAFPFWCFFHFSRIRTWSRYLIKASLPQESSIFGEVWKLFWSPCVVQRTNSWSFWKVWGSLPLNHGVVCIRSGSYLLLPVSSLVMGDGREMVVMVSGGDWFTPYWSIRPRLSGFGRNSSTWAPHPNKSIQVWTHP